MQANILKIVEELKMQPHPEGGYFVETYRSAISVDHSGKSVATVIYFLLPSSETSSWHRIKSDEFWFYHSGSPIIVHSIENGNYTATVVGNDFSSGHIPQHLVRGGAIFGASVQQPDSYSLVSCVVAPGFDFEDFELFSKEEMLELYPQLAEQINLLF
jgi:predicted cupin superfamily sugar epimerase